jgi:hypothetical protein
MLQDKLISWEKPVVRELIFPGHHFVHRNVSVCADGFLGAIKKLSIKFTLLE